MKKKCSTGSFPDGRLPVLFRESGKGLQQSNEKKEEIIMAAQIETRSEDSRKQTKIHDNAVSYTISTIYSVYRIKRKG